MTELERLLDGDSTDRVSERERELLGSLRPTVEDKSVVWQRVSGSLLAAGAVTAASSKGAAAVASGWLGQALVVVGLATPFVGGGYYLWSRAQEKPPAAHVAAPSVPTRASSPAEPSPAPADSIEPAPAGEPLDEVTPARRSVEPGAHDLEEENRLLREARALYKSGDAAGARAALNRLAQRFPRGALGQERDFLRVQIALTSGESNARALGQRFVNRYPNSPYAARVSKLLDGSQ